MTIASPANATPDLPRLDLGLADLAPRYDLVLCDVWGVVHNGIHHHHSAVDALRRFRQGGGSVVLVTNAPAPTAQVVTRLDRLQVPRDAYDDVATSGDVTVAAILDAGCPPVFNIGPSGEVAIYREAARIGGRAPVLTMIEAAKLAICVSLDETGDLPADYDETLRRLRAREIEMICANPDIVVEVGDELVYCAGAIAERYAAMGGKVTHAGKPFPAIYDRALAMARRVRGEVARDRILAIGDALRTDMAGARNQAIDAMMITSGIHRAELHDEDQTIDATKLARALTEAGVQPIAALPYLTWTVRPGTV